MNIVLVGYGSMGQIVHKNMSFNDKLCGIISEGYLSNFEEVSDKIDVIIDFSHPSNLDLIYNYCKKTQTPVVIATTGYTEEQLEKINDLKNYAPVLFSANFSLGVILLNKVIREITPALKDKFDIEIIEKHHNKKIDSPSGTAKLLLDSVNKDNDFNVYNGRVGTSKRNKMDLCMHSIRGGSIVGEHSVLYCGLDEVLEFKHEAHSKAIFAKGALSGAAYLMDKECGLYNMEDVLFN